MRVVPLDAGPLGLISNARGKPRADACRQWVKDLTAAGVRVVVPEIADYEIRRELIRLGYVQGIRRLDQVKATLDYVPITTGIMLRAAEFWAQARRMGRMTAPPDALDADCILAATAELAANPGDVVTVATANVGHLGLFVHAQPWETILP